MAESFDEYIDAFLLGVSPYGVAMTFLRNPAVPPGSGELPHRLSIGTVRMSEAHLKVMAILLKRQIVALEAQRGYIIPLGAKTLAELDIALEDWESFGKTLDRPSFM